MNLSTMRHRSWALFPVAFVAAASMMLAAAGCGKKGDATAAAPNLNAPPANIPTNAPPGVAQTIQGSQQQGQQANQQAAAAAAAMRAARQQTGDK